MFRDLAPTHWHHFRQAKSPWLVFTSPASVQAFAHWIAQIDLSVSRWPGLRFATVGSGTQQSLVALESIGFLNAADRANVLSSADAHRADAVTLVSAMHARVTELGLAWPTQTVMVVEGCDNRPQLKESLAALGAQVMGLALYERVNVAWPQTVIQQLKAAQPGQVAVVITSTQALDLALRQIEEAGIDSSRLVWCTHHQSIALTLAQMRAGLQGRIRRVRLDPQALQEDLFSHEQYW